MTADSTSNFNGIVDTFLDVLDDKCKDHVYENFPILRLGKLCLYKSNRTTMRPLGIYLIEIYIYFGCDSFPDDYGRFWRVFLKC